MYNESKKRKLYTNRAKCFVVVLNCYQSVFQSVSRTQITGNFFVAVNYITFSLYLSLVYVRRSEILCLANWIIFVTDDGVSFRLNTGSTQCVCYVTYICLSDSSQTADFYNAFCLQLAENFTVTFLCFVDYDDGVQKLFSRWLENCSLQTI